MAFVYTDGVVTGADFGRGPEVDQIMLDWYNGFMTQGKIRLAKMARYSGDTEASPEAVNERYS